jgi:pilus assembly protein FimV
MRGDKLFRRVAAIAAISMLPCFATAAGLGKINVLSALGQPLLAEIDLVSVSAEEFPSLAAKLASQDAYREANVEYPNGLGGFRFVIDKRANGQAYLKVVTNQPINEPFLDLLIELNWAGGRLLREYPVLLDPPGYNIAKPQAPAIKPPQVVSPKPATKPSPSVSAQPAESAPATPAAAETASAPSAAVKSANGASDTYGPVRSGETLRQIASTTRQTDVSLEQMLVALFRENKGAFIDRNMNRLKTGMILKVPAPTDAAAISPDVAKKEVTAQTANWNAYRKRLASAAVQGEKSGQSAGGTIDTKVSDAAAPPDSGKDVLKLSKGGQIADAKAGAENKISREKLNAAQEEVASRDKALDEARTRIALLENEISKMRQLLELKGMPLPAEKPAAMEKPPVAPTAKVIPPAEPPMPKPVEVPPTPAVTAEPPAVTQDMSNMPAAEEPPVVPKRPKRITLAPPPPAEPSLLDGLLENPLIPIAGAAILALLGFVGFKQFRKRKNAQLGAFTATGAIPGGFKLAPAANPAAASLTSDAGNSSFLSDFDKIGAGNIDTDEVDPVAEADVYIAYGRDAQAEEILKEANAKDPTRYEIPLKLLEIYSNRKSIQAFETVAKQLHGSIGTQHPLWSKVAEMGRKLDASNALYAPVTLTAGAERGTGESSVIRAVSGIGAAGLAAEQVPAAMKDTMTVKEPVIENAPLDLDLDFDAVSSAPNSAVGGNLSPDTSALDFDLGIEGDAGEHSASLNTGSAGSSGDPFVLDFDLDSPEAVPNVRNEEHSPATATNTDFALDLSFDTAPATEKPLDAPSFNDDAKPVMDSMSSGVDLPALDLSDIDLSLGSDNSTAGADPGKSGGNWQSAETKLDLARAYLEIGDKVGAVEILQEVIKEGSPAQQEEAKKLAAQA